MNCVDQINIACLIRKALHDSESTNILDQVALYSNEIIDFLEKSSNFEDLTGVSNSVDNKSLVNIFEALGAAINLPLDEEKFLDNLSSI